jgi:hypothetical protein
MKHVMAQTVIFEIFCVQNYMYFVYIYSAYVGSIFYSAEPLSIKHMISMETTSKAGIKYRPPSHQFQTRSMLLQMVLPNIFEELATSVAKICFQLIKTHTY